MPGKEVSYTIPPERVLKTLEYFKMGVESRFLVFSVFKGCKKTVQGGRLSHSAGPFKTPPSTLQP